MRFRTITYEKKTSPEFAIIFIQPFLNTTSIGTALVLLSLIGGERLWEKIRRPQQ
jgi:hypothetical protein